MDQRRRENLVVGGAVLFGLLIILLAWGVSIEMKNEGRLTSPERARKPPPLPIQEPSGSKLTKPETSPEPLPKAAERRAVKPLVVQSGVLISKQLRAISSSELVKADSGLSPSTVPVSDERRSVVVARVAGQDFYRLAIGCKFRRLLCDQPDTIVFFVNDKEVSRANYWPGTCDVWQEVELTEPGPWAAKLVGIYPALWAHPCNSVTFRIMSPNLRLEDWQNPNKADNYRIE
jgi:hypothetical protein